MSITVVMDNIRSAYNVGSIARTCDGLGVERLIAFGITPYPGLPNDTRLPHVADKATRSIQKTALGAERLIQDYVDSVEQLLKELGGQPLVCLEQTSHSIAIRKYQPVSDFALVLGNEVNGVSSRLLTIAADHVEIPMHGQKESFNVSVACAIALYDFMNR